ncbi:hypothetical protein FRC03_002207 [Tulasnella sp. 419]|nr:hypothetical protein FRC03_002207 [Tulasnella sp. 419]
MVFTLQEFITQRLIDLIISRNADHPPTNDLNQWCVEYGNSGYIIRNAGSNYHISISPAPPEVPASSNNTESSTIIASIAEDTKDNEIATEDRWTKLKVIGSRDSTDLWNIEEADSSYYIRSASKPELVLDVEGFGAYNGAHVIIKGGLLKKLTTSNRPRIPEKVILGPYRQEYIHSEPVLSCWRDPMEKPRSEM